MNQCPTSLRLPSVSNYLPGSRPSTAWQMDRCCLLSRAGRKPKQGVCLLPNQHQWPNQRCSTANTSSSVTRSLLIACRKKCPRYMSRVGSALMSPLNALKRTESQVMANYRKISRANATRPSVSATSLESRTVANIEPKTTVTIKSKAFILESVRFPEALSSKIKLPYATTPMSTIRKTLLQLLKNVFHRSFSLE